MTTGKMMAALAAGALAGMVFGEGQITRINSSSRVDFKAYALKLNDFAFDADRAFDAMDELRVCEAIDNSKLIVFGLGKERQFARTGAFVFGTPSIATSLDGFFKRGGLLYFEPSSWAVYNSWADKARRFFAARGATVPDGSNYKDPNAGKGDRNMDGAICADSGGALFAAPRAPEPLRAVRHFAGPAAETFEPYARTADGRTLLMGRRIAAGAVVFSLVHSVQARAQSAFWDNAVEALYGKAAVRKSAGRTVYLREAKARGLDGLYVREAPVFTPLFADTPPPADGAELNRLDLLLARGEKELAQIVFYNCTEENRLYRLEPKMHDPNGRIFRFLDVKPRRNEFGRVQNEIVTPLDASGTVFVPSGETKALLLAAETDLPAGKYDWSFELVPVNFEETPRKIAVTADVLDLAFEGEMPNVYLFGPYEMTWSTGQVEKYQDFFAAHHVNYVSTRGNIWKRVLKKNAAGEIVLSEDPADYLLDEKRLQARGLKWVYGYGLLEAVNARMKELGVAMDWRDPKLVALVDRALARWVKTLKENGVDLGAAYEPVRDEPHAKNLDDFIVAADLVRKHGMKVAVDVATWCTLDDVRRLAPHVDMFEPWEHRLTTRATGAEELALYKASGKPMRPYLCSMSGNTDPYLGYHRFRGIRAFRLGGDGFCTWAANSWRGNDYRACDNEVGHTGGRCPGAWYVHHGDGEPVGTLRLEALREGAEDLYWLRRAAREGKAKDIVADAALAALDRSADPARTRAWRNALLRALAR